MFAIDSASHPDPQAVKDSGALFIGQYVPTRYQAYGVTRAEMDAYRATCVRVLLIFEEWASQFQGGASAAQGMIGRMLASCAQLGVTPGVDFLPAVALVDPRPGDVIGHEDDLQYFAQEIDVLLGCEWTGYGSARGLELAAQVAPHMTRRWGVGTWGYGERSDGTMPDPLPSPADLIQHGNLGYVEIGGIFCDPNTAYRSDMGQWPLDDQEDDLKLDDVIPNALGTDGQPLTVGAALGFAANVSALLLERRNPSDGDSGPVKDGPLDLMDRAASKILAGVPGSAGGLTPAEVRAIVREELDKTKLGA